MSKKQTSSPQIALKALDKLAQKPNIKLKEKINLLQKVEQELKQELFKIYNQQKNE